MPRKGGIFILVKIETKKEKALRLLQEKLNGERNTSYNQLVTLTGYSRRQLIRLYKLLNEKDIDSVLVHGNTERKPSNSANHIELEFIKEFKKQYPIISISQFMDFYHEDVIWNIQIRNTVKDNNLKERSYSFFKKLYKNESWITPINHRSFDKKKEAHPLREPSPRIGMLVMIDGTPHDWFCNGQKFSLHLAIDDATGKVLAGWFTKEESQLGYCYMLRILLKKWGIPLAFYSDKHTILKSPKDGNLTQFGRMCNELGIELIFANTPQAKGKVERMNETIQNRLLNDIKRNNIKSYDELNKWFNSHYVGYLNRKFSYKAKELEEDFVSLGDIDLTNILCLKVKRQILDGNVISINNRYFMPIDNDNNSVTLYLGTEVEVWQDVFNGKIRIYHNKKIYNTKIIPGHIRDNEKINQLKINNQKEMDQALRERDKRIKERN